MNLSDFEKIHELTKQRQALKELEADLEQAHGPNFNLNYEGFSDRKYTNTVVLKVVSEVQKTIQDEIKKKVLDRTVRELLTVNGQLKSFGVDTMA